MNRVLPDATTFAALAQERRDELLALLSALVEAPSEDGETAAEAQCVLARYLEGAGYHIELVADDNAPVDRHAHSARVVCSDLRPVNLIARPAVQTNEVALFAHIDTEHPGAGWTSPPHTAQMRRGRLFGLGAADDKAGVAAAAVAAAALVTAGGPAPLILSVHGKSGGARGTLPVFAQLGRLDVALYLHPAETGRGLSEIKHASRGVVDVTVQIDGWHGSEREIGRPETSPFDEGGNALDALVSAVNRWRTRALQGCEINIGRITAGDSAATVPTHCEAEIRIIFDDARSVSDVVAAITRDLEAAASKEYARHRHFQARAVRQTGADSARLVWDHPWCRTVADAVRSIVGTPPRSYVGHLASDIRFPIRLLGAPAVGVGSLGGNFYSADEWIDLDDLMRLVAVAMRSVWAWCEGARI